MSIHPTAVIDRDVLIGEGTKVWHFTHVQSGARIGRQCNLGQNVYVGSAVTIGDCCKLQNNVSVYQGVTLGNGVFCGPSCVFTNDLTPRALYPKGTEHFLPTVVMDGASIGANATIVCGHTIGKNAMIGAGAVVVSDVPDHVLMLGVPAKPAGFVCACGQRLDGLICPVCGRKYKKIGEGLAETE
ncbi:MAG TPA: acyltransferase [Candidatus Limiplasma sp.]|nr:acyltransferase [Candidatus Limiplasma sp.]